MEKEEYIRKLQDFNRRFLELEREKKELNQQYIRESHPQEYFKPVISPDSSIDGMSGTGSDDGIRIPTRRQQFY